MRVTTTLLTALPLLACSAAAAPGFQFPFTKKPQQHDDAFPGRGEVIDLSKYTIGQILNYTLYHHRHDDHDHDHEQCRQDSNGMARIFEEHRHTPPLVKLAWVVNRTDAIKEYLSDSDVSVTLFAPDDEALTPPHREGRSHSFADAEDAALEEAALIDHPLYKYTADVEAHLAKDKDGDDDDDGDDKDKERKRAFIKKIVTAILRYHISPSKLYFNEIQDKQTIATSLNQTKDVGVPFRIRASPRLDLLPPPPKFDVSLNFYARIRNGPALLAKNGIIHFLSAPLLPPLTPLDQLLAFPLPFSALTSAVQQTELDSALAPWLHHQAHEKASFADMLQGNGADEPSSIALAVLEELVQEAKAASGLPNSDDFKAFPFTIFAPTNRAFAQIPFRIRTFLFSPFGKQYLKKLLQFHVVPQQIFHSDYHLNATRDTKEIAAPVAESGKLPAFFKDDETFFSPASLGHMPRLPFHPPGKPGKSPRHPHEGDRKADVTRHVLPTLLGSAKNESLAVNVYEYRIGFGKGPLVRRLAVGHVGQDEHDFSKVWIGDGVAWGGAVHVIGSLIRPPFHGHDHDHEHEHTIASLGQDEYFKTLWT